MKILCLSNLYPPNVVGGYERLCFDVTSALVERGHRAMVLTSDYGGDTRDYPGQAVRRELKLLVGDGSIYRPFSGSREEKAAIDAGNIAAFERALGDFGPDIVFVWNLYFLDASLLRAIQDRKVPNVFLLTDNWLIAFLNGTYLQRYFAEKVFGGPRSLLSSWRLRLIGLIKKQKPLVIEGRAIFASRFMEDLYRDAGFRFSRSTVIYHGIPGGAATAKNLDFRRQLLKKGELRLLFAGRVVEIKGVHTALEALPKIVAALPHLRVRLTILGDRLDPAYDVRLNGLVDRLGLAEYVEFVPAVSEDALEALFSGYDVYLFPSLYEPFSLTLIHALRAGIPTIASDAGGNVEIVRHKQSGMIFRRSAPRSLAERVIELARADSLRLTLAKSGAEIGRQHTFAGMVEQVQDYLMSSR